MRYTLREVVGKSDFRKFIELPYRLYKNTPQYVPNLRSDERSIFTNAPSLEYCKLKMWIVLDGKRVVGRVAGIINPRYNDLHNRECARFGWIEFEEDIEIARLLLQGVEQWAKSEGMTQVHGPMGYNTWYKQGMLVSGFENTPPINCIWNFPYYPKFLNELGYQKESDWIQYLLPAGQGVSEKLEHISTVLMKRYPFSFVDVREIKNNMDLVEKFFSTYNETFRKVPYFVPLTDKEIEVLGKSYIKLLRPEINCFVMDDKRRIAAYGICFPSMSEGYKKAKGRLFPFGWYHILKSFRKYDTIDLMMVGADPAWQNKGVSAIFHNKLANEFAARGIKFGVTNPQNESNLAIKVWDDYKDKELFMRRRCFVKSI